MESDQAQNLKFPDAADEAEDAPKGAVELVKEQYEKLKEAQASEDKPYDRPEGIHPDILPEEQVLSLLIKTRKEEGGLDTEEYLKLRAHMAAIIATSVKLGEYVFRAKDEIIRLQRELQAHKTKQVFRDPNKSNRNDPCSCGSGFKYKKCCGVGQPVGS
jgi:hypothetical protein